MRPRLTAMISKVLKKVGARLLRARGYSDYFAPILAGEIYTDLRRGAKIGLKRRWWGYRRGFLGDTVAYYNLTEETYRDYLPDLPYFKLHPLNGDWGKWIDDKLTMRYVLAPFAEYLPKYYFHLRGGEICRLMDCPADLAADAAGVLALLQQETHLAVKLVQGSGGEGFYKLEWQDGALVLNGKPISTVEFDRFVTGCTNYIVSEYLTAHILFRKIYPRTANTIRMWTVHEPGKASCITGAFMRFGTTKSGQVDNVAAGGISCGIRVDSGILFRPCREERNQVFDLEVHPDTGIPFEISVPYWEKVKEKVLQICAYVPQLRYLGFDVVITDGGFKILEINSHQSATVQLHQPFLQHPTSRQFFLQALKTKGIEIGQT